MADISISLNNIRKTRTLYVEGIGGFTVRKLGAGEELDMSDKMRRLGAIIKELRSIDLSKYDANKPKDIKEIEKISRRMEKLSDEIGAIQRFELETYKRCFVPDGKPEDVDTLMDQLSADDRNALFSKLFDTVTPLEAPDKVEAPEVDKDTSTDAKEAEKA